MSPITPISGWAAAARPRCGQHARPPQLQSPQLLALLGFAGVQLSNAAPPAVLLVTLTRQGQGAPTQYSVSTGWQPRAVLQLQHLMIIRVRHHGRLQLIRLNRRRQHLCGQTSLAKVMGRRPLTLALARRMQNFEAWRRPPPPAAAPATMPFAFNGMLLVLCAALYAPTAAAGGLSFAAPLFGEGMILQRGDGTRVWGTGAAPGSTVTISLSPAGGDIVHSSATALSGGNWSVEMPRIGAAASASLSVTDGTDTAQLSDVAVGDIMLCSGQSNMGLGMCSSQSKTQTPQQALDALPAGLRVFLWYGSGPGGGSGKRCKTSSGVYSVTPSKSWFTANATTAGGFSAVCLLTVQRLHEANNGTVPVGAVESCVSGTSVQRWMPPGTDTNDPLNCSYRGHNVCGDLWTGNIEPLLPISVSAVLWDQGEADAKRDNASCEPKLLSPECVDG
eukprot:SAG11_NODE_2312_length_3537_cov_11.743455_2_plen_447_part_00